jgi:hypothetical protein
LEVESQWHLVRFNHPHCLVSANIISAGVQLAINDISPSPQCLGTVNGIALTLNSAVRAIVPAAASSIYAFGVSRQILWGELGWAVLIALAVGFAILVQWLPEKAEGRAAIKKNVGDGDEEE